jgi:hypothetical protein
VALVLLIVGGLLIGGAISTRQQRAPMFLVVMLGLCGVIATVAGALRL